MFLAIVFLATAPVVVTTSHATPGAEPDSRCQPNRIVTAAQAETPLLHPLGAEPPAQSLYAVSREVDGCYAPIVLAPQVGTPPVR